MKHRLLLELGRGGMGTVFLAVTEGPAGFSKLKVVKRLRADLAADPQFLRMFLDEARLTARLSHANVVQTHEVGWDGTHYFIEMEYLEGQTLDALMRASKLRVADGLWILTQVLAGLHHAHELKDLEGEPLHVVHRDVSPHNVFVTYDGHVKVLDFGIAKAKDSSVETRTGVVKGKVTYMAPEQAGRRAVDRRADLFAAGVMLWQMLTGRRLWADLTEGEIFSKLERGEILAPREVNAEVPEALDAICLRAIAVSPDDRYATALEFQRAVESYVEASGERSGSRSVAEAMTTLFDERRRSTRREVEARLRAASDRRALDDVDVPLLGHSPAYAETKSLEVGPSTVSGPREPSAAIEPKAATRAQIASSGKSRAIQTAGVAMIAAAVIGVAAFVPSKKRAAPVDDAHAAVARACVKNAECGAGSICRSGACVSVASEDCRVIAEPGDVANDRTIWIGAMFPLTGPDAARFGQANANAADLARRDFVTMSSGLPSQEIGAPPRPIALVACDDAVNPSRAARHLVDDLAVPAVVGFHRSKELVDLATSTFVPKDVLAVAALNTSPLVTRVPHPPGAPRLVWRTNVSASAWVAPLAHVVSDVDEPELRASKVVAKDEPIKVALVRTSNSGTLGVADALFTALRFNGKSAAENGDDFRQFVFGDHVGSDAPPDYAGTAAAVAEYRPHVVLYVDGDVFTDALLGPIEAAWPSNVRYRPRYASAGPLASDGVIRFAAGDRDRRRRLLGIDTPASAIPNVKLAMRYSEVFTPRVTAATAPGVAYDAFYLLAYAAYAAGDEPLTGASLSRAITRLVPPGIPIDVGPTHIADAFEALRGGKNVDLNGAVTKLDFDLETGEPASDFAVYCLSASTNEAIESGLVYRPGGAKLEGAMRCR